MLRYASCSSVVGPRVTGQPPPRRSACSARRCSSPYSSVKSSSTAALSASSARWIRASIRSCRWPPSGAWRPAGRLAPEDSAQNDIRRGAECQRVHRRDACRDWRPETDRRGGPSCSSTSRARHRGPLPGFLEAAMSRVRLHRLDHALLILAVSAGCERSDPLTAPPRVLAPHAALGVPIIVTKTSDDGSPGTLRHAIQTATSEDVIQFDRSIPGQTITLTQELVLEAVKRTIEGPVARGITINANATGRVFFLSSGAELTLSNVTITGSRALPGIALSNSKLTLSNSTMSGNVSQFSGGAIASFASTVTIINSTISGNHADENGGGIYTGLGSTTEIIYSTISNNS